MVKRYELTPLKRKSLASHLRIAAGDVESKGTRSAHFRCASLAWEARGGKGGTHVEVKTFWSEKEFFEACGQFDVVYFYNLGYDSVYLRNYALESGEWKEFPISSGSRLLGIIFTRADGKKIIIKDFWQFGQKKLEVICKETGIQEQKYPVDFDHCSDEDIARHNVQDVKMLLAFIKLARQSWWDEFGVDVCKKRTYSVPSAAMQVFRANFVKKPIVNPFFSILFSPGGATVKPLQEEERFVRGSYKGGFTNVHDNGLHENIFSLDVTSEYPFAATAIRFPAGDAFWVTDLDAFLHHVKKIPGFARGKFYCPVPLICGKREGKLVQLQGEFTETLTSYEILAILKHGGQVLEFERGLCFTSYDEHNSVARYVTRMFKLKRKGTGAIGKVAKLCLNSLYGKFGQDYEQETREIRDGDYATIEEGEGVEVFESTSGKCIGLYVVTSFSPKPFMNVAWASLITAFARIYLLERAIAIGSIYEDTDSLKVKYLVPFPELDLDDKGDLGYFKKEEILLKFRALAPKVYAGVTNKGEKLVKCKGVPHGEATKLIDRILNNESLVTGKYVKIMGALEGLRAKHYVDKDGFLGGIRETFKKLQPVPKPIYVDEQPVRHPAEEALLEEKRQKAYERQARRYQEGIVREMEENFDDFARVFIDPSLTRGEQKQQRRDAWKKIKEAME